MSTPFPALFSYKPLPFKSCEQPKSNFQKENLQNEPVKFLSPQDLSLTSVTLHSHPLKIKNPHFMGLTDDSPLNKCQTREAGRLRERYALNTPKKKTAAKVFVAGAGGSVAGSYPYDRTKEKKAKRWG